MAPIFSKLALTEAHKKRNDNKCEKNCFGCLSNDNIAYKILTIDNLGEDAKKEHGAHVLTKDVRDAAKLLKKPLLSTSQHVKVEHKEPFYSENGKDKDASYCCDCFQYLYDISSRQYDRIKQSAKVTEMMSNKIDIISQKYGFHAKKRKVNDVEKDSHFGNVLDARAFKNECEKLGMETGFLDEDDLRYMCIPNTAQSHECFHFLDSFFNLNCDRPPNNYDGICELPASTYQKSEIYKVYLFDCKRRQGENYEPVSLSTFEKMWINLFPNVSIVQYVAVAGKCQICAELYAMQESCSSSEQYKKIKFIMNCHRSAITKQRLAYYQRRVLAQDHPEMYMSIILDGMQQNHTKIPYYANQKTASSVVTHHLQGAKVHGQCNSFYITLPHIDNGFNVNCEVLLAEIKRKKDKCKEDGTCFPRVLFIQIDGGAENVAQAMFGLCEVLVDHKVFDKIELNRLPVGHTHEDIDALFGTIWSHLRSKTILSPHEFRTLVAKAFQSPVSKVFGGR